MNGCQLGVLAMASTFFLSMTAVAQEAAKGDDVVQLTVTSVSDRSVYLDHGRDVGLKVGSIVKLFPPGAAFVEVEVRSASTSSSRADLPPGVPVPPVGTRGEATVVRPDTTVQEPAPAAPPQRTVPEHPPWARRDGLRTEDQPLLVPTFSQRPDERPATLDGRWFASGQLTQDRGANRDSDYLLLRTGLRADATNYLGMGERVRIAGEYDDRRVMLKDAPDQDQQTGRLDIASIAFGTEQWAPTGVEIGRFFSSHLPDIGLFDGIEVVERGLGGVAFGAGFGSYPRPFPARDTGTDTGVHAFFEYVADKRRTWGGTIGLQKTWHEGSPDRDLLVLRGDAHPTDRTWLFGSAKLDYYTSTDTIKGSGIELTELMTQARWNGETFGAGLGVSHFSWPELKREEYQFLPVELVRDGYVNRLSLSGSVRATNDLSLRGHTDLWQDQSKNGTAFGLDADWRQLITTRSTLSLSLYQSDGGYSNGPGMRVTYRDGLGDGTWEIGYRWMSYTLGDLVSGSESFTRQSVYGGISVPVGDHGDLDLNLERSFGDGEDATSFGFYMQWRF